MAPCWPPSRCRSVSTTRSSRSQARIHAAEHRLLVDTLRHSPRPLSTHRPPTPTTTTNPTTTRKRLGMNDQNATLFDRYDALTFDDVVVVPGYSETLPDAVDTSAVFAADIVLVGPARLGGDGQGHRGADGDRHGPPRRHRRDPSQPADRRSGGRGAEGQAQPERHDLRSGHAAADRARCSRPRS